MTTYKIHNINGKFDHVDGKSAALTRIREIEGDANMTETEMTRDHGWTITRVSASAARAVGL